jgi:hypothetical protein
MTRVAIRCFAATVTAAMALSGAALAGDMSSAEKFKKMDTNGDGKLSAAEHDAWARDMFMKMDTNKDGSVTAAEMDASHHRMMKDHSKMDNKKTEAKPKTSGY